MDVDKLIEKWKKKGELEFFDFAEKLQEYFEQDIIPASSIQNYVDAVNTLVFEDANEGRLADILVDMWELYQSENNMLQKIFIQFDDGKISEEDFKLLIEELKTLRYLWILGIIRRLQGCEIQFEQSKNEAMRVLLKQGRYG